MPRTEKQPALWGLESTGCFFGNVGTALFMPAQVQAASRKERVRAYRTHRTRWF